MLCDANGAHGYTRTVVPAYGHIDCIFGRNDATRQPTSIRRLPSIWMRT